MNRKKNGKIETRIMWSILKESGKLIELEKLSG